MSRCSERTWLVRDNLYRRVSTCCAQGALRARSSGNRKRRGRNLPPKVLHVAALYEDPSDPLELIFDGPKNAFEFSQRHHVQAETGKDLERLHHVQQVGVHDGALDAVTPSKTGKAGGPALQAFSREFILLNATAMSKK